MYKNGRGGCNICDSKSLGAMRYLMGGWGYLQNFQKNHLIGMGSHHLVLDAPGEQSMIVYIV